MDGALKIALYQLGGTEKIKQLVINQKPVITFFSNFQETLFGIDTIEYTMKFDIWTRNTVWAVKLFSSLLLRYIHKVK